ncbi:MAG: long-chain fatty acid--CoA ligase [Candidatus Omnitrophica bacterium]|nr:long-chain fatty acid--CoA ligase [Candidatus Omnitrophota bacterium]
MNETIPARFDRQVATRSAHPLFLTKRGGAYHPITWQQADNDVVALSNYLLIRQVNPGDRLLILSENRPEWAMADLAIQSVGAWTVPLYPNLLPEDLAMIANNCEPVGAIASSPDQIRKLLAIIPRVPSLRWIIALDPHDQASNLLTPWSEALAKGSEQGTRLEEVRQARRSRLQPDETATLLYTSGTTGEPKGVMLTHRNLLSNVDACLRILPITSQDLHLSFLPLSHIFERMAGWYLMLSAGACVAYAESMETIALNMAEAHPTVMLGVPRIFEKLYARIHEHLQQASPFKRRIATWALNVGQRATAHQATGRRLPLPLAVQRWLADHLVYRALRKRLGGRLKFFVSGSAPLSKEIAEFFYWVGIIILEGYGLTETSPVITVNRPPRPRFGSVGQRIPDVEVRIAEDGEILTRGPGVMQGYYRNPQATAGVLVDGWFSTGDIGHLDQDGYLFITDRKKDLIKTAGGKFVAPQKLESLFVTDPHIAQAFVYGDRHPYCVALIVPQIERLRRYAQEQEIASRSLQELVREPRIIEFYWTLVQAKQQGCPSFEQVKKIALLDQEFSQTSGELTPTLKAKRSVIAQRYASLLQSLYEP